MGTTLNSSLSVTMETVARDAGVSRATVSRVLSGSANVLEPVRQRVLASCRRLGYVRNEAATQLARRSSNTIGLLLRDAINPSYAYLHDELLRQTFALDMIVTTMSTGTMDLPREEANHIDRLLALRPLGLFISTGVITTKQILPYLNQIPIIITPRPDPCPEFNVIGYDEVDNATKLVSYVTRSGHKKIGIVTTPKKLSYTENLRTTKIAQLLEEHGIKPVRVRGPMISNTVELTDYVEEALKDKRFSALMFPNDYRALEFIIEAQKRGIKVPDDVGVTGMDGLGIGTEVVGLTTIRVPVEKVAERAAKVMHALVTESGAGDSPVRELYEGKIVHGRTLC